MALHFTSTIEQPVHLPGAPYHVGDPIAVEHHDVWREGIVRAITRFDKPQRFGLNWLIRVDFIDTGCDHECTAVAADDDGLNHTWRNKVCGSRREVVA